MSTTEKAPPAPPAEEEAPLPPQLDPGVAAGQNLTGENAVAEQRPQSFLVNADVESDLSKRLREEGALADDASPMPASAFERAGSESQMKKAAKDSRSEGLMVGNGARATKGPHEGRVFAITRITEFGSQADQMNTATGSPAQLYNQPAEVEATAIGDERDGERLILNVEDNGLEKFNEGLRGTRAGRLH